MLQQLIDGFLLLFFLHFDLPTLKKKKILLLFLLIFSLVGDVNVWDAPVHYECPGDGFVTGMGSYHDNDKEDRRFKFQCCEVQGKRLTSVIFNVTRTFRASLSGTFLQTL